LLYIIQFYLTFDFPLEKLNILFKKCCSLMIAKFIHIFKQPILNMWMIKLYFGISADNFPAEILFYLTFKYGMDIILLYFLGILFDSLFRGGNVHEKDLSA